MGDLREAEGVAVWGDQLIVSGCVYGFYTGTVLGSLYNGRVCVTGRSGSNEFSYLPSRYLHIKADHQGRLWVQSADGAVDLYSLPLSGSSQRTTVFTPKSQLQVLGAVSYDLAPALTDLHPVRTPACYGYLIHNSRVLRIRNPLSSPLSMLILGQLDDEGEPMQSRGCAGTQGESDMLRYPSTLALDRLGNLYVSDHSLEVQGNFRLLVFSGTLFPEANTSLITALPATKVFQQRPPSRELPGCQGSTQ